MTRSQFALPVLAAALMATSTAAFAADQFDLLCTGTSQSPVSRKKEAWSERYRIDLTKGEWCQGDCSLVEKIASVTSGTLALKDVKGQGPRDSSAWILINRVTGVVEARYLSYSFGSSEEDGTCSATEFSGFPAENRKF